MMRCQSCQEDYEQWNAGTCKECYEEASETKEELKREIEDLKAKVAFLLIFPPVYPNFSNTNTDLILHGVLYSHDTSTEASPASSSITPAVPAHRLVLMSRSPVFKAMLETEMEECKSGTIRIHGVSYDVLCAFVKYLYTSEVPLDEQRACDLLVLAEKYQVKHLKAFCEKFMMSILNSDNAIASYAFAHQHHAGLLIDAALAFIIKNMPALTQREDYKELVQKEPRLVVQIYETYMTLQIGMEEKADAKGRKSFVQGFTRMGS